MMLDALRAAQVAAGVPHGDGGASGRNQPGAAEAPAAGAWRRSTCRCSGIARFDEVPRRPAHHPGQRVLRRAAGAPGDQAAQRLVRARGRARRRRQPRVFGMRQRSASRCSSSCCRPQRARRTDRRDLSNGAPTSCRSRLSAAHHAPGRRGAGDRLRARRQRGRRDPAGGRPPRIRQSAARRPARSILPPMSTFEALARAVESMGARVHGPVEQAQFLRRLGIEKRAAALKA